MRRFDENRYQRYEDDVLDVRRVVVHRDIWMYGGNDWDLIINHAMRSLFSRGVQRIAKKYAISWTVVQQGYFATCGGGVVGEWLAGNHQIVLSTFFYVMGCHSGSIEAHAAVEVSICHLWPEIARMHAPLFAFSATTRKGSSSNSGRNRRYDELVQKFSKAFE